MTANEFDDGMNLIFTRWPAKQYPEPLRMRIWYHCQALPYKSFERIVLTLMDVSRAAPMPREFQILANIERDRIGLRGNAEPESQPSSEAKCWDCADSGNLFARHKAKNYEGVFRCHCEVGRRRPHTQGVQWSTQYTQWWTKDPAYVPGQGNWRPSKDQSLLESLALLTGKAPKEKRKSELRPARETFNPKDAGES
jgi:hypothetical protein